jgi:hypothetical protein
MNHSSPTAGNGVTPSRLLPVGIQDFTKLREQGFCYVDKTTTIHQLITSTCGSVFLSRPRRFGKSLLCSTLAAIFEGRRELFQELAGRPALAIDSLGWGWRKHPVLRFDWSAGQYADGSAAVHRFLRYGLARHARKFGIALEPNDVLTQFQQLIHEAHEMTGERVVVVVDEYDHPLLDTIRDRDTHNQVRNELHGFYAVLKSLDEHLRFVFITGITKFSQVALFSGANQLIDLSLAEPYAAICGFTQEELERNFEPEILAAMVKTGKTRDACLSDVRMFYNGYRFTKAPLTVYNPFGMLQHFWNNSEFQPYWYVSGSPSYLIKMVSDGKLNILQLRKPRIAYNDFHNFTADTMDPTVVLYQAGYLTIADFDQQENEFVLDYPNTEVRAAFNNSLITHYLAVDRTDAHALTKTLPRAFINGSVDQAIQAMRSFLASIPYDIIKPTENYYETAIFIMLAATGLQCQAEHRTSNGRIDALVETCDFVYCFEFKLDKPASQALAQIEQKEYTLKWESGPRKVFKIGVAIDSTTRTLADWRVETVEAVSAADTFPGGGNQ